MQEVYSSDAIVSKIADRVSASARVETIYGEPREIGDKTVIPVARVEYVFGAGGGGGTGPSSDNGSKVSIGGGAGGGGAVRVRPVGVLEVTNEGTRMVPVLDWTRIITIAMTFAGAWMLIRAVFRTRK